MVMGQDWVASLVAKGWRYSTSPTKGAVVSVLGGFGGTPGEYGHVAIVEAVNTDGSSLFRNVISEEYRIRSIFLSFIQLTTIHLRHQIKKERR